MTDLPAYPILEFDPSRTALLEPARLVQRADVAEACVLCFFQEVIARVCADARLVTHFGSERGRNPVYEIETDGQRLVVMHPGVGAPLAAGFLEEAIALGCRKFIVCGGCGVLDGTLAVGDVIVPTSAVRDEGTSYHYLPPAREVAADPAALAAVEATLARHGIPYTRGKAWTTDAFYRETPAKIARRKAEGCIVVEMEASAFFAVAQFRGVTLGQLLYGGDDVSGEVWDSRDWIHGRASTREKLFWLAAEAALRL
jgi:uridine phosphorylase